MNLQYQNKRKKVAWKRVKTCNALLSSMVRMDLEVIIITPFSPSNPYSFLANSFLSTLICPMLSLFKVLKVSILIVLLSSITNGTFFSKPNYSSVRLSDTLLLHPNKTNPIIINLIVFIFFYKMLLNICRMKRTKI